MISRHTQYLQLLFLQKLKYIFYKAKLDSFTLSRISLRFLGSYYPKTIFDPASWCVLLYLFSISQLYIIKLMTSPPYQFADPNKQYLLSYVLIIQFASHINDSYSVLLMSSNLKLLSPPLCTKSLHRVDEYLS
jgi:hypothetical protein